jgi:hypothetical protein
MAATIEETILNKVYTLLSAAFTNVTFGVPDINNDATYIWVSANVERDVYYYDGNFEIYLIYIYISSTDYISAMNAAHTIRTIFHQKSLSLGAGFTNLNTFCASRDIIMEEDFEGAITRTLRIVPVNIRAVIL